MALEMTLDKSLAGEVSASPFLNSSSALDQPGKWAADLETLMNCLL
jgi:hypothetical protein